MSPRVLGASTDAETDPAPSEQATGSAAYDDSKNTTQDEAEDDSLRGRDPAAISGPSEPVCVTMPKARLRVGPSQTAKVSWVVGQHMPLERLKSKDGWSQVRDMRGQVHWVVSKALAANEACAVVRVRTAALHQGPGFGAPRADFKSADRYSTFRRVDREGQWVRVEDNRRGTYWTLETNLWIPIKKSRMAF